MNTVDKAKKFDICGTIAFLALLVLCVLTLVFDFAKIDGQSIKLTGMPLDFEPASTMMLVTLCICVLKALINFAAIANKASQTFLVLSTLLSAFGIIAFAVLYPQAWFFQTDTWFGGSITLLTGGYFVFAVPVAFVGILIWDILRQSSAYPYKIVDTSKIKDVSTRQFFLSLHEMKGCRPDYSVQFSVVFLLLFFVSLVGLTFPHGITYTQAAQTLSTEQLDVFYFLFRRDYIFMVFQTSLAILFLANHLLNSGLLKTTTQNFTRSLIFVRLAATFGYTLLFSIEFPLICQLASFFNGVDSFTPTIAYLIHFVSPVVLLAGFWLDSIMSISKSKQFRIEASACERQRNRLPLLTLLHSIGYGLGAVFAALSLGFPFLKFHSQSGESISVFLYGGYAKVYYPSFLPDGGAAALYSIYILVAVVIIVCSFSLFAFSLSRITKRPTNLTALIPFLVKAVTTVAYSILFAVILSDLQGMEKLFLVGYHNGGVLNQGLSWHTGFVAILILLLTLWADTMTSVISMLKKPHTNNIHQNSRKNKQMEQRLAELESEAAILREKLADSEQTSTE